MRLWVLEELIDNIAPLAPARFSVEKEGSTVNLHWPQVTHGVNGTQELFGVNYEIYSHTTNAYFDPDNDGVLEATVSDTSYMYNGEAIRKYFIVRAIDSDNKSSITERKGKYGFTVSTGDNPIFNHLSLPLETSSITNAKTMAAAVEGVLTVLKLDTLTNGYSTFYLPTVNYGDNFDLSAGMPVLISASNATPENWFYTGSVPAKKSVQFKLNNAAAGSFNEIMVPLDRTDLNTADKLAKDIGGVTVVLKIDPETNGFSTFWLPAINFGDNFTIEPGEPILINVNTEAPNIWPVYAE